MHVSTFQLFVYGSLRKGFHHPAYRYISDHFHFVGNARVKGILYDLGDFPAAVPAMEDRFIIGELYRIIHQDEFSWAIAQLDDYEGVDAEAGELPMYRRDIVTVQCGGDISDAWVYWYCGDVSGRPIISSGDVLAYRDSKNR
jgi:gamma-glutamylcyclotransferase (GGCT)/AIG2-like uncharacterized protein YtfP